MFTNVILVCVHDLQDDIVVNHNLLYSIFSNYGEVLRILIFERSNTFKAFLEYASPQSALLAKKNLNRALLFQGRCRMSIYPSNLQTIKFQNNYPGGVDYTLTPFPFQNKELLQGQFSTGMNMPMSPIRFSPRSYNNYNENGSSKSSSSNNHSATEEDEANEEEILQMINRHHRENKEYDFDGEGYCFDHEEKEEDDYNKLFQGGFTSFGTFQKEFGSNISDEKMKRCPQNSSSFSHLKLNTRLPCFPQSHSEIATSFEHIPLSSRSFGSAISEPPISRFYSMDEIPSGFDSHEDHLFQPLQKFSPVRNMENFAVHSESKENVNQNIPEKSMSVENKSQETETRSKEENEKPSPVLHVLGIENKEVTTKMLFNIFSNFGNIVKLIFIKTRAVALVEFENMSSATLAKEYLHNVAFFGKPLRITYSKYPKIQLQPGQGEKYPEQLIIGEEKLFRFKQGKNIVIAPPSCTLHVSNLTKESCKDKKGISDLFGKYGEVKAVKSLFGENGKNMCLLKMKSIEECLKVMAQLHDTEFGGRKLQISFSRSKV